MRITKRLAKEVWVGAALCAPLCLGAVAAQAQAAAGALVPERASEVKGAADRVEPRVVRIKDMPVRVMAFLLDPQHQPEHLLFSTSRGNASELATPAPTLGELFHVPVLPPGASIVEVNEPQNTLLLRGTAEALDAWQAAILALDKPLQQIEVEAQLVKLTLPALKYLGAPTETAGPHLLPYNVDVKLRSLLATKEAAILMAPRVTAISGLTASLSSMTMAPINGPAGVDGAQAPVPVIVGRKVGLAVRPTVRPGETIDMEVAFGYSWMAQAGGGQPTPLQPAQQETLRVRDGDAYLFYARPDFAPAPAAAPLPGSAVAAAPPAPVVPAQADAQGRVSVFIVRARIIRRAVIAEQALMPGLIRQGRIEAAR